MRFFSRAVRIEPAISDNFILPIILGNMKLSTSFAYFNRHPSANHRHCSKKGRPPRPALLRQTGPQ
jgi:hypothetical protein